MEGGDGHWLYQALRSRSSGQHAGCRQPDGRLGDVFDPLDWGETLITPGGLRQRELSARLPAMAGRRAGRRWRRWRHSRGSPRAGGVYDHVAAQGGPVDRDEVAAAVGLPRTTAAFHLDRLGAVRTARRHTSGAAQRPYRPGRRGGPSKPTGGCGHHGGRDGSRSGTTTSRASCSPGALDEADAVGGAALDGARPAWPAHMAGELGGGIAGRGRRAGAAGGTTATSPGRTATSVVLGNCPFHVLARAHSAAGLRHEPEPAGRRARRRPGGGARRRAVSDRGHVLRPSAPLRLTAPPLEVSAQLRLV